MSATFACPHCGATYPVKPVLVGKAVRCTKCRNAFKLRPDGIADKVEMEAPAPAAPAPAAAPAPSAPAPRPAARPEPAPAPAPAPPARASAPAPARTPSAPASVPAPTGPKPDTEAVARAKAERLKLNQRQEEARRAMAGTLANAAAAALQAESVKREAAKGEKDKSRSARSAAGAPGKVGGPAIGPVLVVGEGELEASNRKRWLLGGVALAIAIVVLGWLVSLRSETRAALEAFAAPVDPSHAKYPQRLTRMQARAWLSNVRVLTEVGSARFGSEVRHELASAREPLAELMKDRSFLPQHDLWVRTSDAAKLQKLWSPKKDRAANLAALGDAGVDTVTQADFAARLAEGGLGAEGVAVLMQLLLPTQGAPQDAAARVAKGELPDAIEVVEFTGSKGTAIVDAGSTYKFQDTGYTGRMLRFVGEGWPREWRVLSLDFVR